MRPRHLLVPTLAALVAAAPAPADRLPAGWLPRDVSWVVHVDLDAAAASPLAPHLDAAQNEELHIDLEGLDVDLEEIRRAREALQIRWRDIHGITAYGSSSDSELAILIIEMNEQLDRMIEQLRSESDVRDRRLGEHAVMEWHDGDGTTLVHVRPGAGPDRRLAVLADDEALLGACLLRMDVGDPHSRELEQGPRPTSIVFARTSELRSWHDAEAASHIISLSEAARAELWHDAETMHAELRVRAADREAARDVADVIQGLIALGRLIEAETGGEEALREVARCVELGVEEEDIVLSLCWSP
jgi:hypothetical protein